MMEQALEEFQQEQNIKFEKVTLMPLEGEGTISHRMKKFVLLPVRSHGPGVN